MIFVEGSTAKLKGDVSTLCSDIAVAIRSLKTSMLNIGISEKEADDLISKSIELAKKSDRDLLEEAKNIMIKRFEDLFEEWERKGE